MEVEEEKARQDLGLGPPIAVVVFVTVARLELLSILSLLMLLASIRVVDLPLDSVDDTTVDEILLAN